MTLIKLHWMSLTLGERLFGWITRLRQTKAIALIGRAKSGRKFPKYSLAYKVRHE
jgi:hypothetical protein